MIFSFTFNFKSVIFYQTLHLLFIYIILYIFSERVFHIPHGFAHVLTPLHVDRVPPWTVKQSTFISWWAHWSSISIDSAIGTGFYKLLSVFALLYMLYMSNYFIWQHSSIIEPIIKQRQLAFILFDFQPGIACISAIYSMVNTCRTSLRQHGIPRVCSASQLA